jgi:hypothetical protein
MIYHLIYYYYNFALIHYSITINNFQFDFISMQINLGTTKIYFTENSNLRIRLIFCFCNMYLQFINFIKICLGSLDFLNYLLHAINLFGIILSVQTTKVILDHYLKRYFVIDLSIYNL